MRIMTAIAVVGCGYWGKNLVRNFAQLGALAAICDEDPEALRRQSTLYPDIRVTTRYEDVLEDDSIDAVVVATPAIRHYDHARVALERDKDVFVEKPLAVRFGEGKQLVELAAERGRMLMVGHILEYHPAVTHLRSIVERGELGDLWYIYSNRLNLGKVRREENILWSFAPHDISLILRLAGQEPEWVRATGSNHVRADVADVTTTNLGFSNGISAHVFVSWLHPYKEQRLVVIGDRKMAVFDDTMLEGKLKIFDKGIDWDGDVPIARHTSETTLFIEDAEPLRIECQDFLRAVSDRSAPLADGESALRVLKVLEASQLSLERNGETVRVAEIDGR